MRPRPDRPSPAPSPPRRRLIALVLAAAVAGGAGWVAARDVERDLSTERDLHAVAHVGSDGCRRCHEDHHASWHRTFHRTMTQEAGEASVLGDFGDARLEYMGVTARMHRDGGGRFLITFAGPGGRGQRTVEVERTVGSHRYQQYLARQDDLYVRLPVAWDVAERRWLHMNGAFLTPDPEEPPPGASVSVADYDRHVVRWNDNCVFCHNVAPNPGWVEVAGRFDTQVAELGIGCEACHGPGEEHARLNASPLRRYALHLGEQGDPTIVNPGRLAPERSAEICGRCHGQRITEDVSRFLVQGDDYVPGDELASYSAPLWRDTTLDGEEGVFAPRFWPDGTPRLSAYEYQGLLQSPCAQRGELTCVTCHGMHDGDPAGQLRPEARGDGACTGCHAELADPAALGRHSGHDPAGAGARCAGCHMPKLVYGLVSVLPSHRVEVPDPAAAARLGRPDACTSCHADETRAWAAAEAARLWPGRGSVGLAARPGDLPEAAWAALGGDPIERAVGVHALGAGMAPASAAQRAVRRGVLLDVMESDPYPAVRRIAWKALRALEPAAGARTPYDPMARAGERRRVVRALEDRLGAGAVRRPPPALLSGLRAHAAQVAIHIGE